MHEMLSAHLFCSNINLGCVSGVCVRGAVCVCVWGGGGGVAFN